MLALVVVIVIAIAAFVLFFDPNDYKPQIDAALSRQLGRPVQIDGKIELSMFPWLAIKTGRATIANAQGFGDQPLASIASAAAGVRVWPLLGGDVKIGTVSLNGLKLNLERRADGHSNWRPVLVNLTAEPDDSGSHGSTSTSSGHDGQGSQSSFIQSLAIQAVAVDGAAVVYTAPNVTYRFGNAQLETGSIKNGEPFKLDIGGDFEAPTSGLEAELTLSARVTPQFDAMRYAVDKLHAEAIAQGKALAGGPQTITLDGQAKTDLNAGTFSIADLTLKAAGVSAIANVNGHGLSSEPSYNGTLRVKPFDPRAALKKLGVPVGSQMAKNALNSAQFSADFSGTSERLQAKALTARIDDSDVKGTASARFAPPAYKFDIDVDKLDADRYMAPSSQSRGSDSGASGDSAHASQPRVDLSFLKGLTLDGHANIGALTVNGARTRDVAADVDAANGVLHIKPLTAALYGGRLKLTARVDARAKAPRYASQAKLTEVRFRPLLADFANIHMLSGTGNLAFDLQSAGNQLRALERSLDGTARLAIGRGTLHGIDLRQILTAVSQGQSFKQALVASKTTVFHDLTSRFRVRRGVVRGDDLSLDTRAVNVRGAGSYDLPDNDLDYIVKLIVADSAEGKLARFAGVAVPVQLRGPLGAPRVGVDAKQAIREQARDRLQKAANSLGERLRKKLNGDAKKNDDSPGDDIKQKLKQLFGD